MSWMAYDPSEEIKKLEMPVLIGLGTTDIQVSIKHLVALSKARPDARLSAIIGMNHVLKKAEKDRMKNLATYFDPELPVMPELIRELSSFIWNVDSKIQVPSPR